MVEKDVLVCILVLLDVVEKYVLSMYPGVIGFSKGVSSLLLISGIVQDYNNLATSRVIKDIGWDGIRGHITRLGDYNPRVGLGAKSVSNI